MSNKPTRFLFRVDNSRHDNVTINWRDSPLDEFAIYAEAYHRASEILMKDLLSTPSFHDIDPCPIVFLYRHSVELYLKEICLLGYNLFQILNQRLLFHGNDLEPKKLFQKHELVPLVKVANQIFIKLGWNWDLEDSFNYFKRYEDFESVISEIDDLDSGSYTFRYPYNKFEETASLDKGFSFNVALFQEKINVVLNALDGISTQLRIELESTLKTKYSQQQDERYPIQ